MAAGSRPETMCRAQCLFSEHSASAAVESLSNFQKGTGDVTITVLLVYVIKFIVFSSPMDHANTSSLL